MLGLFGTAFGLSLQAKALAGGGAKPLNCTACGVLAAALVAVMTFNLEAGIRRLAIRGRAGALQGAPARGMPFRVRVRSALQSYGSGLIG